VRVWGVA